MKYQMHVIGAGGTGTYFLKELGRYLSDGRFQDILYGPIQIWDGDVVEAKNLGRQAFCRDDVGRYKSVVMAEILEGEFNVPFEARTAYLIDMEQLSAEFEVKEIRGETLVPLFISCVDNHAARLLLEEVFNSLQNCVLFDSGNEVCTGEVSFSYKKNGKVIGPCRSHYFPDMRTGDLRNVTEMSCAELNNASPQHIFTNMLAGNMLLNGVANLFEGHITPGFAFFDRSIYSCQFVPYRMEK